MVGDSVQRAGIASSIEKFRDPALMTIEVGAWFLAVFAACGLRLETWSVAPNLFLSEGSQQIPLFGVLTVVAVGATVTLVVGYATGLHRGRARIGTFEELALLAAAVGAGAVPAMIVNAVGPNLLVPRAVPVLALFITLLFALAPRAVWRAVNERFEITRETVYGDPVPVIVVGAGAAGRQLVDSMLSDPQSRWAPVAFVDDDSGKRMRRYRGVRVQGTIDDLARVAAETEAETVVVAIRSAGSRLLNRVRRSAGDSLSVKILPRLDAVLGDVSVSSVRDVEAADLLGRHQIQTDVTAVREYLHGQRVLVIGAGGSIGSELSRQLAEFELGALLLLDRDESALHSLMLSLSGRADLESPNIILADIRDAARMRDVMRAHRPDVVFHAAALKHVNMLENHPDEAIKSNVIGTLNVLDAAFGFGVKTFVNISTDKAADPVNVLGYTKRIAEGLTAKYAARTRGKFMSVRFGNVLGTRGSVLKTFEAQVAAGGPLTVTDPEVTRFFMTVDEAVQLVIQAAVIGRDGEALVLDMGDPVSINDVAKQVAKFAGKPDMKIVYTGLKPGEKLHEELFGSGEQDLRPIHPLISHVAVPLVTRGEAEELVRPTVEETMGALRQAVDDMAKALAEQQQVSA